MGVPLRACVDCEYSAPKLKRDGTPRIKFYCRRPAEKRFDKVLGWQEPPINRSCQVERGDYDSDALNFPTPQDCGPDAQHFKARVLMHVDMQGNRRPVTQFIKRIPVDTGVTYNKQDEIPDVPGPKFIFALCALALLGLGWVIVKYT